MKCCYEAHPKSEQDSFENTFGVIRSYCASNCNPTLAQSVDASKTCIVNDLAFRGVCGTNFDDTSG
jgi:hypothetical protein